MVGTEVSPRWWTSGGGVLKTSVAEENQKGGEIVNDIMELKSLFTPRAFLFGLVLLRCSPVIVFPMFWLLLGL